MAFIRSLNGNGTPAAVSADPSNQPRASFGSGYQFDDADRALFAAQDAWLATKANPENGQVRVTSFIQVDLIAPGEDDE